MSYALRLTVSYELGFLELGLLVDVERWGKEVAAGSRSHSYGLRLSDAFLYGLWRINARQHGRRIAAGSRSYNYSLRLLELGLSQGIAAGSRPYSYDLELTMT